VKPIDVSLKGRNNLRQLTPRTQRQHVRMHGQRGGTVVLKGTATPCQIISCRSLRCTLSMVGRSFVFGVMADSVRCTLALNMYALILRMMESSLNSKKWEENLLERQRKLTGLGRTCCFFGFRSSVWVWFWMKLS